MSKHESRLLPYRLGVLCVMYEAVVQCDREVFSGGNRFAGSSKDLDRKGEANPPLPLLLALHQASSSRQSLYTKPLSSPQCPPHTVEYGPFIGTQRAKGFRASLARTRDKGPCPYPNQESRTRTRHVTDTIAV